MDVSSSTSSASIQATVQKKAQDVQAQQVTKVIEDATEQSKDVSSQKTGIGRSLNITG